MESVGLQERPPEPKTSSANIWREFEVYETKAQKGFETQEERLGSYATFMQKLVLYFGDPSIRHSADARDLVRKLFYQHDQTAAIPVGFFHDAAERLKDEVLEGGYVKPATKAWATELSVLNDMLRGELGKVATNLNLEKTSREKLERLARKRGLYEIPRSSESKTIEEKQKEIQEIALEILYQDPEFTPDIARRDEFVSALDGLIDHLPDDPQKLRDALEPYEDFLGPDLDDLYIRTASSQDAQVIQKISQLAKQAKGKDFMWRYWVQKGDVPGTLFDSFEEIISLGELQKASESVANLPKEEKARALLPFIQKGISAELIEQIVEEKYEFPDNFVRQQVDAFMHFFDEYERQKGQPGVFKRKFMASVLAGMLAASPLAWVPPEPAEQAAPLIQNLPSEKETGGVESGQPVGESKVGTLEWESLTPVNDSPENLEKNMENVLWELSGENLWGFYRSKSAYELSTVYDSKTKSFIHQWFIDRRYSPNHDIVFSREKDMAMLSNITISPNGRVGLPVLAGYAPVKNGVRFVGSENLHPAVYQTTDGAYFLQFFSKDAGKTVTISIDLGKSEKGTIPSLLTKQTFELLTPLVSFEKLPDDVQKLMKQLNQRSLTERAKILEKYVQQTFTYSLNSKWSDYYHQGKNMDEFFKRIFTVKRTDCDLANTALIALLRNAGIPSRLVYGYAHTGVFNSNEKILNGAEGHGWTEAFINGKWIQLDATPSKMDDFTKKALQGRLSSSQLQNLSDSSPLGGLGDGGGAGDGTRRELSGEERKKLDEEAEREIEDLEQKENIRKLILDYKDPALSVLTNAAALGAAMLLQRGNRKLALEIQQEVDKKLRLYLGTSFPKSERELKQKAMAAYRVPDVGKGTNPLALIPPFGIAKLFMEVANRIGLETVTYRKKQSLPQTSTPNATEFYESSLGDKKKNILKRLFSPTRKATLKEGLVEDSYEQAERQVWDGLWEKVTDLFNEDVAWLRYEDKLHDRVSKRLGDLKAPDDPVDLTVLKADLAKQLFTDYLRARRRVEAKIAKEQKSKEGEQSEIKPALTKDRFEALVEEIMPYELVLWQMRNARAEAGVNPNRLAELLNIR